MLRRFVRHRATAAAAASAAVRTAHSALANPLVMEAANNIQRAVAQYPLADDVHVGEWPGHVGVRVSIDRGRQVDAAARIVRRMLGEPPTEQWVLDRAKGIRKGSEYDLTLSHTSLGMRLRLMLQREHTDSSGGLGSAQVIIEAPSISTETARNIAAAANCQRPDLTLRELEQMLEPLACRSSSSSSSSSSSRGRGSMYDGAPSNAPHSLPHL